MYGEPAPNPRKAAEHLVAVASKYGYRRGSHDPQGKVSFVRQFDDPATGRVISVTIVFAAPSIVRRVAEFEGLHVGVQKWFPAAESDKLATEAPDVVQADLQLLLADLAMPDHHSMSPLYRPCAHCGTRLSSFRTCAADEETYECLSPKTCPNYPEAST